MLDFTPVPRGSAGIGTYVRELAKALLPFEDRVELSLFLQNPQRGEVDPAFRRLPRVERRWPEKLWRGSVWASHRLGIAQDRIVGDIDLFHGTDNLLPNLRNLPSVITLFDFGFLRHPETVSPANRLFLKTMMPRFVRAAERCIAISEFTRAEALDLFDLPAEKVAVAHLGVGSEFLPAGEEAVQSLRQRYELDGPYLLFVGTTEPRKNLGSVLRALRLPECAGLKLVVAGSGGWGEGDVRESFDALEAQGRIRRLGRVAQSDLPALYTGAELLVFPSIYEGFGIPLLEAMACGCPVICSDRASLPEVAGDAAVLVASTSADAWAEAIVGVLEDTAKRRCLRERGLARAREFTWRRTAERTLDFYETVHARRS
jgi:glycosyltransferase involved in cell wall biosynthesis